MRLTLAVLTLFVATAPARGDDPPLAEKFLIEGKLAEGEKALRDQGDDQARFGKGMIQFLRAVERMSQNLCRYGVANQLSPIGMVFGRNIAMPFAPTADPRVVRYADVRAGMQLWIDDLAEAEATLARIKDDSVKLPLHFGQIRMDFDGDGKAGEEEILWKLYAQVNARAGRQVTAEGARDFVIAFDRGDVAWLRGYCHLLMAMSEAALAYDGKELFARCGHLVFAKTDSPFGAMLRANRKNDQGWDVDPFLDLIAAIHLLNMPLSEPKRMGEALKHLEAMVALSRESWKFYLAETDNDHEWVPNPKQDTVMPGGKVTDEMVKGWMEFLDAADSLLAGKALVPFWRGPAGVGVNFRKVFTEPRDFDLVLWVQGTAAVPYLEDGPKMTGDQWRRLQRVFGGEFIGFAFWFN